MNESPVTQVIDKAIVDIQSLAQGLDAVNQNKLVTSIRDLERKNSALQPFVINRVIRTE